MKPINIRLIMALCLVSGFAQATPNPIYFSESGSGTMDGSSPANAQSIVWVNSGNVPPNSTVSVVGLVSEFMVQANGETVLIPGGSGISSPNSPGIYVSAGVSGLTIDGTGGGFIANTANGSALANQTPIWAIQCGGAVTGLSVKNLAITNIYVHTLLSDSAIGADTSGGIYCNGIYGSNFFGNILVSNAATGIVVNGSGTAVCSNCTFQWCNHGIFPGSANGGSVVIENCFFGDCSNWDSTANSFHNDGIIWFGSGTLNSFILSGCTFNGDMGAHNTAYFFDDGGGANFNLFANNLFIVHAGNMLNNSCFTGGGSIINNTFINLGTSLNGAISVAGAWATIENNIIEGFGTFVSLGGPVVNSSINHNLYANWSGAGNPPWSASGVSYNSFSAWLAAVPETSSMYLQGTVVNPDGTVPTNSPAIGGGSNMSSIIQTDINGAPRPTNSAWTIGAFNVTFTGSLAVDIFPTNAIAAGAEWQVDGGAFETNGAIVTNLPVGQHVVTFNTIAGWLTPPSQTILIGTNTLTTVNGTFTNVPGTGGLKVTILSTNAVAAGAEWQTNGGPFISSGTFLNLVPAGNYVVSFNSILANWTPPPPVIVPVATGVLTQVTNFYSRYSLHVIGTATNDLNGLVAWWTLDDLSGADLTGDGNTLTFAGGPASVSSEITNGVSFNGYSQSAFIGSAPVTAVPLTLTCWFNTTSSSGVIMGLFNGAQANWFAYFVSMGSGAINGVTVNNNTFIGGGSPLTYNDGNWHFSATVFTSGQQILYMDGNPVQTNSTAQTPTGLNEFCIGASQRSGATDNYFNGAVDDVRIYNRALSAAEIANQYLWPTGGKP